MPLPKRNGRTQKGGRIMSLWDTFMPIIKVVATKEALKDLQFYRDHDSELYFTGLTLAATCLTLFEVGAFVAVMWACLLGQIIPALLALIIALVAGNGFSEIKLYLHNRKDAIEIKETLQEMMKNG